jgi:hypothetical protein
LLALPYLLALLPFLPSSLVLPLLLLTLLLWPLRRCRFAGAAKLLALPPLLVLLPLLPPSLVLLLRRCCCAIAAFAGLAALLLPPLLEDLHLSCHL